MIRILFTIVLCLFGNDLWASEAFSWPQGQSVAVSLSYDDAIETQLDNAVPVLNKYKVRASFYLTLANRSLLTRLDEWRKVAQDGHELGNHTVFHPCIASLPERNWVLPFRDLDKYAPEQIEEEIKTANAFLKAVDGRERRTYTPTCFDTKTSGEDYLERVRHLFVSIKGFEQAPEGFATVIGGEYKTAQQLLALLDEEREKGTKLVNIIFHGVGGDYLDISKEEHEKFVKQLSARKKIYWVDSYINITRYLNAKKIEKLGSN